MSEAQFINGETFPTFQDCRCCHFKSRYCQKLACLEISVKEQGLYSDHSLDKYWKIHSIWQFWSFHAPAYSWTDFQSRVVFVVADVLSPIAESIFRVCRTLPCRSRAEKNFCFCIGVFASFFVRVENWLVFDNLFRIPNFICSTSPISHVSGVTCSRPQRSVRRKEVSKKEAIYCCWLWSYVWTLPCVISWRLYMGSCPTSKQWHRYSSSCYYLMSTS